MQDDEIAYTKRHKKYQRMFEFSELVSL